MDFEEKSDILRSGVRQVWDGSEDAEMGPGRKGRRPQSRRRGIRTWVEME